MVYSITWRIKWQKVKNVLNVDIQCMQKEKTVNQKELGFITSVVTATVISPKRFLNQNNLFV